LSDKFSTFFIEDTIPQQYTACVAVLLFRELKSRKIIFADNVDIYDCIRGKDFRIPKGYAPPSGVGHCMIRKYKYTNETGKYTNQFDKPLVRKICKEIICTDASSPNEVHENIIECINKYYDTDGSRKSTLVKSHR